MKQKDRPTLQTKKAFPLGQVYGLLEPGPVVLLVTSRKRKANIMTLSWQTMLDFMPPLIGVVVSDRNYSFAALKSTKECTINIPAQKLSKAIVGCGNSTGRTMEKFEKFGLSPEKSSVVKAPLIQECFAKLECRVVDTKLVSKYNFFVLQVVKAWVDPLQKNPKTLHHRGQGLFMVAGRTIHLPSKKK